MSSRTTAVSSPEKGLVRTQSRRALGRSGRLIGWFGVGIVAVSMLFPFAWSLSTSLQTKETILRIPPQLIPREPSLASYRPTRRTSGWRNP